MVDAGSWETYLLAKFLAQIHGVMGQRKPGNVLSAEDVEWHLGSKMNACVYGVKRFEHEWSADP